MKTSEQTSADAELQETLDRIAKGIPFTREEQDQAAAEIARIREENAKLFGVQNVVVDVVREMRNSR
jgi:hypothetical protein